MCLQTRISELGYQTCWNKQQRMIQKVGTRLSFLGTLEHRQHFFWMALILILPTY